MPSTAFEYKSKKSGKTYYLHSKDVSLRGGRKSVIYFFAGKIKTDEVLSKLPPGKEIVENPRTGLPMLKKSAN